MRQLASCGEGLDVRPKRMFRRLAAMVAAVAAGALLAAPAVLAGAIVHDPGCTSNTLARNDDGSTALVPLGLGANLFGTTYTAVYVNNNGNLTFNGPLGDFTPGPIAGGGQPIIAPFWADVDTQNPASAEAGYGQTTFAGRPAFCATWDDIGVGYYASNVDKLNKFQVLLVDRSDIGAGNFDIVYNYDQVQWETGDASGGSGGLGGSSARAGFSDGNVSDLTGSFEFPGSAVNGAFLDSNLDTGLIHGSRNSSQIGRYVFPIRNGAPPGLGQIEGDVTGGAGSNPVAGALVQVCRKTGTARCVWQGVTNAVGHYDATGVADGDFDVRAYPPAGSNLIPGRIDVLISGSSHVTGADIHLVGPTPPPPGTSISPSSIGGGGIPVVYWNDPLTLTTANCPGGTASYSIQLNDGGPPVTGSMTEGPAGTYTATVPPFSPRSGQAHVRITVNCPGGGTTFVDFDLYIDPSGFVHDTFDDPIAGATVTLHRSDTGLPGTFDQVSDGSAIMSPSNRTNPDSTDATGHFGWDVIAGFYLVRAQKAACHAPGNPGQPFVETAVLTIPPPVFDLDLVLECPTFADVPASNPFYGYIEQLYDLGITTGCGTNGLGQLIFCPGDPVPRQQMAAFLIRAKGLTQLFSVTPTFADVPTSNPFYGYIERLFQQGITTGCGTNGLGQLIYCPGDFVPRQQMAAFLIRAKGLTQLFSPTPTFADVPTSNPFYGWIERLFQQAITTGCGTNGVGALIYCPADNVPRQQMAAFLIRAFA